MLTLFASAAADACPHGTTPHTFLLTLALFAAMWLACAVIAFAGYFIGALVFVGIPELVRACRRSIHRRHSNCEPADVDTDADSTGSEIVDLDHYRPRRQQHAGDDEPA